MTDRLELRDIPVTLTPDFVNTALGDRVGRLKLDKYLPLVNDIAKPKAIINWVDCEVVDDKHVKIDGRIFTSAILAERLKDLRRVIVYIITAGDSILKCDVIKSSGVKDMLGAAVLRYSRELLNDFLSREMGMKIVTVLLPGTVTDWDLKENIDICEIVGDVSGIGVTVRENGYMEPWNSSSGILVTNSEEDYDCRLCSSPDCSDRQAAFSEEEHQRLFG